MRSTFSGFSTLQVPEKCLNVNYHRQTTWSEILNSAHVLLQVLKLGSQVPFQQTVTNSFALPSKAYPALQRYFTSVFHFTCLEVIFTHRGVSFGQLIFICKFWELLGKAHVGGSGTLSLGFPPCVCTPYAKDTVYVLSWGKHVFWNSSDPSKQSFFLSHLPLTLIQAPYSQRNLELGQL